MQDLNCKLIYEYIFFYSDKTLLLIFIHKNQTFSRRGEIEVKYAPDIVGNGEEMTKMTTLVSLFDDYACIIAAPEDKFTILSQSYLICSSTFYFWGYPVSFDSKTVNGL